MAKQEIKPGTVLAFRIPETISPDDLLFLQKIANQNIIGRVGPVSEFFFKKLSEERIQVENKLVPLKSFNNEMIEKLKDPIIEKALSLLLKQLLNMDVNTISQSTIVIEQVDNSDMQIPYQHSPAVEPTTFDKDTAALSPVQEKSISVKDETNAIGDETASTAGQDVISSLVLKLRERT